MANITPVDLTGVGTHKRLRNVTAQATTGQTDWIVVPEWADEVIVRFNLTANAGNADKSSQILLKTATRDANDTQWVDTNATTIFTGTAVTAASMHTYRMDDDAAATGTDSATANVTVNVQYDPPRLLGIQVLNIRTAGDETYTYTLDVEFVRP